jgi:hypothetical protein
MAASATTRGVTLAALLAALGRPTWWVLALAGFLVRGGIVLFFLSIVTVPSPLALSNVLAPIVTPLYFGRLDAGTATLIGSAIALAVGWLVLGTWFAAATEVVLARDARDVAADEGLPVGLGPAGGRLLIARTMAAHLVALLPMAVVIGLAAVPIGDVVYRELVNPSDTGPIVLRVLAGATAPSAAIVVAWILGEIVGGHAARRVVLQGESVVDAVGRAALDSVRHPLGHLAAPLVTIVVLALDLGAVLLTVSIVWSDVQDRLIRPFDDVVATGLGLATFAGAWLFALVVTGLITSWRSVAMTFEDERAAAAAEPAGGTFGASAHQPLGG